MDFSGVTNDTSTQVASAVEYILQQNISADDKKAKISKVISGVGEHYHDQLYAATSQVLDSSNMKSSGLQKSDGQADRLALKIVRNYALSRNTTAELITGYYNSLLAQAQKEAFTNAKSMQRHPTLTRTIVGETCKWCDSKAGTHVNPTSEDFTRHKSCDCRFEVNGYNTRNGTLSNYSKQGGKK